MSKKKTRFTDLMVFAAVFLLLIVTTAAAAPVMPELVADFTAEPQSGNAPLTVNFTDTSAGDAITGYQWIFSDDPAAIFTAQNPVHTFSVAGSYSVNHSAANASGTSWKNMSASITVSPAIPPAAPVASFTGSPVSGSLPLAVAFTDTSTGEVITGYQWILGDNPATVYSSRNVTHTFTTEGSFAVNHSATNAGGTSWANESAYITVIPHVNRTWTVGASGCDFTALAAALTNPLLYDGDTIYVTNGSYTLSGTIAKSITLTGEGADVVTVTPSSTTTFSGAGTVVEGLKFTGSSGMTFNTANGIIRNCTFQSRSSSATLSGTGILFDHNSVRNNTVNQVIELSGSNCLITNNTFSYNTGSQAPFRLRSCTGAIIAWNNFTGNNGGITLQGGSGNRAFLNNFIGNTQDIRFQGGATPGPISWNTNGPVDYLYNGEVRNGHLGNFWSSYGGPDSNGDGVGDTAFYLQVSYQTDSFPLVDRVPFYFGAEHSVSSVGISPATLTMNVTDTRQFIATAYEADGYPIPGRNFSWANSNETVGSLNSSGFFTALAAGTTEVSATNASITGMTPVTVLVPSIQAGFTASLVAGVAPMDVQFTDSSQGPAITAWAWDFENDGIVDSTERNPWHTYPSVGNYTVNLTVTGLAGTSTLVREDYISVLGMQSVYAWGSLSNLLGTDIRAISAVGSRAVGIRDDGSLVQWTQPYAGSFTLPPGNDFIQVAVAEGYATAIALRSNGTVVSFGSSVLPAPPYNNFTAVAAGDRFAVGLMPNGSVLAWGNPSPVNGKLSPPSGNDFVAVSARHDHALALRSDGSVAAWGDNGYGQCNAPAGNDFIAVSAGLMHSLALRANHTVVGWGENAFDKATGPAGTFTAIQAGYQNSLAIRSDGSVLVWGAPSLPNPPESAGSNFSAIAVGDSFGIALRDRDPVPDPLTAGFTGGPAWGYVPFTVHFVDYSTGDEFATSWAWDLNGDGTIDSAAQCPEFTYTLPGTSTVNLTVTNANETGFVSKTGYITAFSRPVVSAAPRGWTYTNPVNVTLSASDPFSSSVTTYYTLDGTDPATSGTRVQYSTSVSIGETDSIRFAAINAEGTWSTTNTENYVIAGPLHLADTDSPKFAYDNNNTGRSPYVGPQTANLLWNTTIGRGIYGSPVLCADGTIIAGSWDYNLTAFSPNGTVKWRYKTGNAIWGTPAIDNEGTIYFGSNDKNISAVNSDGTLKWKYPTAYAVYPGIAISPDGTIVGSEYGRNVYGLYPNGTLKWKYTGLYVTYSSPAIGPDGTVYIGAEDNDAYTDKNVYAINPDGTLKWKYWAGYAIRAAPSVGSDGTIYVGTSSTGDVLALNPDGTLKWQYSTGTWIDHSSVAIADDGSLYVGNGHGDLYALSPDGTFKWKYSIVGSIMSSPTIGADGTVYFGGGWNITALTPAGTLKWRYPTRDEVYSSATIASDGTLYIGCRDNELRAFRDLPIVLDANFTADTTSGPAPLTVQFTDTSTGKDVTGYQWVLGDDPATVYTDRNLTHTFTTPGLYSVNHSLTNAAEGTSWMNRTEFINAGNELPGVGFSATPVAGTPPLTVVFNDTSTGEGITGYGWIFSDNPAAVFTDRNVTHVFAMAGTYDVSHSVTNDGGTVWTNRTDCITVTNVPLDVVAISPARHASNGKIFAASIRGTGFQPGYAGTNVTLSRGAKSITGTKVTASSATRLTAQFRIPKNAKPGLYTVTVTNPDGQTDSLVKKFRVTA